MSKNVRIEAMLEYLAGGRIMDAMREFYADDVIMEEPAYGQTVGLAANLDREEAFVASVKEFKNFEAKHVGVGDGVSFYENIMDWTAQDGSEVHVEQVVVALWRDGKIYHERFYYDSAG